MTPDPQPCLHDPRENTVYGRDAIEQRFPEILPMLAAHRGLCADTQPFQLHAHVVSCPACHLRIAGLKNRSLPRRPVETIGFVGFGEFGQFFARHLALWFDVTACDLEDRSAAAHAVGVEWGDLAAVAGRDLVILSVPLKSMEPVLQRLKEHLSPGTTVMDVCSVKQEPMRLIRQYLPDRDVIATHPLFGPQSFALPDVKCKLVVCPPDKPSPRYEFMLAHFQDELKLSILNVSAEEHDREMANVQALTHFLAKALVELDVKASKLSTPSFDLLVQLTGLLSKDSYELFETIQNGNPFAAGVRARLLSALKESNARLEQSS
jgi:prephenate dehydrogenase